MSVLDDLFYKVYTENKNLDIKNVYYLNRYLKNKIKKLSYRSWHRGIRELDLILGKFSDHHLSTFSEEELDEYALVLEENDLNLWKQISESPFKSSSHISPMLKKICKFYDQSNFYTQGVSKSRPGV